MFDFQSLNDIANRVTAGEFNMFLSMYRGSSGHEAVRVTLEKGSTYGKFHMKVEGLGETPSEAFEAALRQFPQNPLDGSKWDTQRLAPPLTGCEAVDAEYTDVTDTTPDHSEG
jgi:hypothetical protein